MFDYKLKELIGYAREHSNYYRNLYDQMPFDVASLESLPILNTDDFWKSMTNENLRYSEKLIFDGLIFKSDAANSTNLKQPSSNSHFSYYLKSEWTSLIQIFARGIAAGPLKRGDRVAHFFYNKNSFG